MKARAAKIKDVFNNESLLRIPYFQRRYVWKEDDWERFVEDMESTLGSDKQYFLGALILQEEDPDPNEKEITEQYKVIDGQQRLTTLSIYMRILHMKTSKNSEFVSQYLHNDSLKTPVIRHSIDDRREYENVMKQDVAREMTGDSNMIKAYNYMLNYFNTKENILNLNDLLFEVKRKVTFVCITLDKEDDEQQTFETINSIGVPLTTGELLKNFLYESTDEAAYKQNWYPVFDTDEAASFWDQSDTKRSQKKDPKDKLIEIFLYAYVRIKMWDFKLNEKQRKDFVKTSNVFSTCKAFHEVFGVSKQDIANEIIEYAKLYKEHLSPDILDERIPSYGGIKRFACLVLATKKRTPLPYILYVLKNVNDEQERNKIFGYLENYIIRRMISEASSQDKTYSEFFAEQLISNKITTFDGLVNHIAKRTTNLAIPNNSSLQLKGPEKKIDEVTARTILYFYETKMALPSANTFNGGFNDYYAEQLMPKPGDAANKNWPKPTNLSDLQDRETLVSTIGNYFLLEGVSGEIKKQHNNPLNAKCSEMAKWADGITSSINKLKSINSWENEDIRTRGQELCKKFSNDIWKI